MTSCEFASDSAKVVSIIRFCQAQMNLVLDNRIKHEFKMPSDSIYAQFGLFSKCSHIVLLLVTCFSIVVTSQRLSVNQMPVCPSRNQTFPCICVMKSAGNLSCDADPSTRLNSMLILLPVNGSMKRDNLSDVESEYVDLSHQSIVKYEKDKLKKFKKLKTLDLSHNLIKSFDRSDMNDLTSLQIINLSNNKHLSKLPSSFFTRNAQLRSIDLSNNNFTEVDVYLLRGIRFLEFFSASNNRIDSVARKAFSTNNRLKVLDLSYNSIKSLPSELLVNLQLLKAVNLSHNLIQSVDSATFQQLTRVVIDLSYNGIKSLPRSTFVECNMISKLDLTHNMLEKIDGEAFIDSDLGIMDLSFNRFTNLSHVPIGDLAAIQVLNVSYNNLAAVNKKSFHLRPNVRLYELAVIDLSHNKLTEVSGSMFEKFASLRYLNMSHNEIRRIGFGSFGNVPTLLEIDLSHNRLRDVSSIGGLFSLNVLKLQFNQLKSVPSIPVALNYLSLEANVIETIPCSSFPAINSLLSLVLRNNSVSSVDSDSFCNLLTLNRLDLTSNNITDLPMFTAALQKLSSLQTLELGDNGIASIASANAFGYLPTLFNLNLSGNGIDHISPAAFNGLLQLQSLNLSRNHLLGFEEKVFSGLTSLRHLDLSFNHLTKIENKSYTVLEDLLSLEYLYLRGNNISQITAKSLPSSPWTPFNIRFVDLSYNFLYSIKTAIGFERVRELDLSHNRIRTLDQNVFGNMSSLISLDLSHNHLTKVPSGSFRLMNSKHVVVIERLDLSHNKIVDVAATEFLNLPFLKHLDLSHNNITNSYEIIYSDHVINGINVALNQNTLASCCCCRQSFFSGFSAHQTIH
jgi:Leucine-rich repeat (LRR) protein